VTSLIAPKKIGSLWIALGLSMAPVIALGLARFSYALFLPTMKEDLQWSYADAGMMNTANALGYLIGAFLTHRLTSLLGEKKSFIIACLITALSIGFSGLTLPFTFLMISRFIAGLSGALAFISGASLASATASGQNSSKASIFVGLYMSGGGIGIILSALIVPELIHSIGWHEGWMALGAMGLIATGLAIPALLSSSEPRLQTDRQSQSHQSYFVTMGPILWAYLLFGLGYISYMTFIIAYLRYSLEIPIRFTSFFWIILGLSSVIAAFLWGPLMARLKGGKGVTATLLTGSLGALIPLITKDSFLIYGSAILFGGSFLNTVAGVTSFVRKSTDSSDWTKLIGMMTISFGLGQSIGPFLSGYLSDSLEGLKAGLEFSVIILFLGALLSFFQKDLKNIPER
jgi:predicted MFS family arabinose efflux permease